MTRHLARFAQYFAVILMANGLAASRALAQAPDVKSLAHRIITTSVAVQPGEVVLIQGGKHTIPLMEALAVEAQMAGAFPNIVLNSDSVARNYELDVPMKYLSQPQRYWGQWYAPVDVLITLPTASDLKALDAGVSIQRFAEMGKAFDFLTPMIDKMKYRELDITYPTDERGASFNLDGPTYVKMMWDAMNVDYSQIASKATALRNMLQQAKTVRVSSPTGTDISFSLQGREIFMETGVITGPQAKGKKAVARTTALPAGMVTVAPRETSASGKVMVPKLSCQYRLMTDISFSVKKGMIEDMTAASGLPCYDSLLAVSKGPTKRFGNVSIGVNPAWHTITDGSAAYFPGEGAGLVFLGFGDNRLLGGANVTSENVGFSFPVTDATVWIDGKKVVDGGKLMF